MKLPPCNFLHCPVTSSLLGPNILLSTLFSNTLSLCSSLNVRDQVWHPYKTTGKITVLYILTFTFVDRRRKLKLCKKTTDAYCKNHKEPSKSLHFVGKTQNYWLLKRVVCIVPTRPWHVKLPNKPLCSYREIQF
jgi:hypothetical protein